MLIKFVNIVRSETAKKSEVIFCTFHLIPDNEYKSAWEIIFISFFFKAEYCDVWKDIQLQWKINCTCN